MNEWLPGWKARDWKKKGGPILNLELWKQADEIVSHHETHWRWVRGHNGHPQNEYANFLATRAAAEQIKFRRVTGIRVQQLAGESEGSRDERTAPFPDLQSFQPRRRSWTT